ALRNVVLRGAGATEWRHRDLRGLGYAAVRPTALRQVLPELHGKGVGDSRFGSARRMGRAAHQGLLLLARAHDAPPCAAQDRDDADRGVSLPPAWAGADVGSVPLAGRRVRHSGFAESPLRLTR